MAKVREESQQRIHDAANIAADAVDAARVEACAAKAAAQQAAQEKAQVESAAERWRQGCSAQLPQQVPDSYSDVLACLVKGTVQSEGRC